MGFWDCFRRFKRFKLFNRVLIEKGLGTKMQISINELLHIIPAINSTQEDDADDESEQYAVPASLMRTEGHYTLQKAIKRAIQYLRGTTYMDTWLSKPDEWTSEGKLRNGKSFEKEFMLSSSGGKSKTNYQNIKFNYPNEVILIFCAIVTVSLCTDMFDSRVFKIAGEKKQVSYQSLRDSLVSEETGKKQSVRLVENQEFVNRMGDALRYAVTKFQDGFSSGKILFDGKKEENTDLSFYWSVDGSKWANYTSQDFSLVKRKKLTSDDGRAEFDNLKKEHENNYPLIKPELFMNKQKYGATS